MGSEKNQGEEGVREFRSRLEDLMPCPELRFPATPGFGRWSMFFPEEAKSHPAKMNLELLRFLVLNFTKPGDVVLDPMAGTYSTCVLASLHGRHGIGVDIEEKFHLWGLEAKRRVEQHPSLTPKGRIVVLKGDARKLSELLEQHREEVSAIITSPPYANRLGDAGLEDDEERGRMKYTRAGAREKENIAFLTYDADVIITSPPYSEGIGHEAGPRASETHKWRLELQRRYTETMKSEGNIARLRHGDIDAIITSPPYADTKKGGEVDEDAMAERWDRAFKQTGEKWDSWGKTWKTEGRKRSLKALGSGYSSSKDNIGNLPLGDVDAVITSPPYCNTFSDWDKTSRSAREGQMPYYSDERFREKRNIGNIPYYSKDLDSKRSPKPPKGKETYLEAMLKVYSECFKVLKPGGRMIVVVKPFVRNKKVIDLPWHTWLLLRKVGFELENLYKFRLPTKSFWRLLYEKKHPEVPRIEHEYIIVVRKP